MEGRNRGREEPAEWRETGREVERKERRERGREEL